MEKTGIFISHITEEKTTAIRMKEFLQSSFGASLPGFVSSDYESIPGGKLWFTTIVDALKNSAVELVLLSSTSLDRRWISFEAGVGMGAGSLVIPVVIRGLERGGVGLPLSSLQIRSLDDAQNVAALLRDVGDAVGRSPKLDGVCQLMAELNSLTGQSPGGWRGVEWQGAYLAIEGPVLTLQKGDPQAYQQSMSDELRKAGFEVRLANRRFLGQTQGNGYKIVYLTDRKNFRYEICDLDVILTARSNEPQQ